ncbi:hypothetical protein [Candidatus Chromulinivorax destructor]|uniref:Uncharacterized protein n=1 Tax=Candidatus Chromulinivorax destructor TaxID=2066483 RepID=A0A345ZAD3_9BACT|nr:hypothetical protein [Candidatus Chromulinivorax destructor]AXK60250.1 hypothetical protein C0J27_00595 [Candidatus Chromulinivorax destructor]
MTKKIFSRKLLFLLIAATIAYNTIDAKLTEDGFSDIRPHHHASFKDDGQACKERIIEEMCCGVDTTPTPHAILNFIELIQIYIEKIKNTSSISFESVDIARIAVLDVARARKMLSKATPAEILNDIRHAIDRVDKQVIQLESYVRKSKIE